MIIIRAKEMYDSVYIALPGTGDKCCTLHVGVVLQAQVKLKITLAE